jgi:penicillin-binding protein 1A
MRLRIITSIRGKDPEFLRKLWLPSALLLALSAGALTGILTSYYLNNSRYALEVTALATYRPPQVTTIYADDGKTVLAQFALEKRIPIKEKEIPVVVEDALLAIEDMRFYDHYGVDPYRVAGVVFRNLTTGRLEGASTITQQLAKNLFLYKDRTYSRKVNEWMVALQIERFYTKRQILEMYMNYVFLGAGSYGFEAGARTYFGKPLKDLSIEQAALLAAIPKSPEYSPTRNSRKALERRNLVLEQMGKFFPEKYPRAVIETAKLKPIDLAPSAYSHSLPRATPWDYPVEEIRKYLEDKYTTRVAQGGLKVYSTINIDAQRTAARAVRQRLREYDRSRGRWLSNYRDILLDDAGKNISGAEEVARRLRNYRHPDWYADEFAEKSVSSGNMEDQRIDEFLSGLVMSVDRVRNQATVRFGRYTAVVGVSDMGRSGKQPRDEFRPGLVCEFRIKDKDTINKTLKVELTQVPEVQASIISLNAKTGEIVAMVGGYDFQWSRFNNATQGLRQTGSAYKPFIYAAAVENGWTPEMVVSGAPIKRGTWMPKNYDGSLSHGNVPMRVALAKSYNLAAVHLLEKVGVQTGAQMVRRFGITNPMSPNLASALGASEASLLEMVAAYSAFPNRGIRMQPHLIRKVENRDGSILEDWDGKSSKVMDPYTALTMVSMMRDVTSGMGTAGGANAAGHPLAGKTGTVNDQTDVWFIGYTPTYVTGVWMGNPTRKVSLGAGMTGGGGALPYFNAFMSQFMKNKKIEAFPKVPEMPADIKRENALRRRDVLEAMSSDEDDTEGVDGETAVPGDPPGPSDSQRTPELPLAQPVPRRNEG